MTDLIREEYRHGFDLPDNRPIPPRQQIEIWKKIMPEALRLGSWPTAKDQDRPKWEAIREMERAVRHKWGWLLNRLDWDREWPSGLDGYYVPRDCQPGAERKPRTLLMRQRPEAPILHGPMRQAIEAALP